MNDDRLRTALRELAHVPPPTDLAGPALARARRDRRRFSAGITAAAGALAAAVLVLPAVSGRATPDTATGAPLPSAYIYAYYGGSSSTIYDPTTQSYRALSFSMPGRSPDGRSWVVPDPGDSLRYGVVDRAGLLAGRPPAHWLLTSHDGPQWSPDSTRLLYSDAAGTWSVDVRTGVRTEIRFSGLGDLAGRVNWVGWRPDGGYLAEVLPAPRTTTDPDGTVQVDHRGTVRIAITDAAGTVRSRAEMLTAGAPALLSPDGSRFFTQYGAAQDLATGRSVQIGGIPAGWLDGDHLVTWDKELSRLRVVDVRTGATTSVTAVPRTVMMPEIQVVDGEPPPGAIVL